jgi:hypothetical protein
VTASISVGPGDGVGDVAPPNDRQRDGSASTSGT